MKSLEARKADRAARAEKAEKDAEESRKIVARGTLAGKQQEADSYDSWTVAELKAELDDRSVEYKSDDKKADLITLPEADDAEGE